jgi:alpha-glucosidase
MDDFDSLVAAAHERGLRVLLDLVACHTSIEHPWFREHPDRYIWSPVDGPPNNWVSAFGGPAWSRDEQTGRWYLHSFYPEQPDLDWRNPEVVAAMQDVVRFWLDRGADGFRLDAIDRLVKDEQLRDDPPATEPFPLPQRPDSERLNQIYSRHRPETIEALRSIREAAGDAFLVGEVFQPTRDYPPYLTVLDSVFCFELLFAPWDAAALRAAIEPALELERVAWVMSNHDFDRLATRLGAASVEDAATLLLMLPGIAFLYQGDEIGMPNGPGREPPFDRAGRDPMRHPMQWDASPRGGFTTGDPWLEPIDPGERSVERQRADAASLLNRYRELIRERRSLPRDFRFLAGDPRTLAFERGGETFRVNTERKPG